MTGRLFWDSFKVLGNLRVRQPLNASLNMFNRVSFWSFCPLWLSRVAPKLFISLGPHNAVLFRDWGKHNRITLYNVGGFVCQEQEANYVDMLLLTRGCTFITHTPAVLKALDKSFILQIPAKTKARNSCHLEVLKAFGKKMRKRILLTPNSPPLSVSLPPSLPVFPSLSSSVCLSWQLSFTSYNGPGLLWRDRLPLPCSSWWREDRGVWVWGRNRTWHHCSLEPD